MHVCVYVCICMYVFVWQSQLKPQWQSAMTTHTHRLKTSLKYMHLYVCEMYFNTLFFNLHWSYNYYKVAPLLWWTKRYSNTMDLLSDSALDNAWAGIQLCTYICVYTCIYRPTGWVYLWWILRLRIMHISMIVPTIPPSGDPRS